MCMKKRNIWVVLAIILWLTVLWYFPLLFRGREQADLPRAQRELLTVWLYGDTLGADGWVRDQTAEFQKKNGNISVWVRQVTHCLYGGILGIVAINQNLANMSNNGKRVAVSPTSKGKLIFSSVLASYITQLIGISLLFVYTIFVLKVDYGNNLPLIILLALVGCLAGLSLGVAIATVFKANENLKTGIVISITMLGCFLSGMMGITMKYIIDKNVPIINKLNPASMITDGFYSLYYYDTLDRFYFNVASLLIFAFVMIGLSMFSLRRQKYDSI